MIEIWFESIDTNENISKCNQGSSARFLRPRFNELPYYRIQLYRCLIIEFSSTVY